MHQNRLLMDKKKSKKPHIPEQKWNPMTTTHILRLWSCTINNSATLPPGDRSSHSDCALKWTASATNSSINDPEKIYIPTESFLTSKACKDNLIPHDETQ